MKRKTAPTILVTRPAPDGAGFAEQLRAAGADPVLTPVMHIRCCGERPDLAGVGALAFTSANGVRAFAAAAPDERSLPVFAVGETTASTARHCGFVDVRAAGGDVDSLAQAIISGAAAGDFAGVVLHVAGTARAGDLAAALGAAGIGARRAVLYEAAPATKLTAAAEAALAAEPPADGAVLFSPRSAAIFVDLVRRSGLEGRLQGVIAACLSEAVAAAASATAWRRIVVAEKPNGESLLSTLLREIEQSHG